MRIVIVGAVLAVLALAACSGDEAPVVEERPAGAPPQPVATEVSTLTDPTDDTASEEIPTPVTMEEPTPVATPLPSVRETRLTETIDHDPTPRSLTLPTVEFPKDIVLLAYQGHVLGKGGDGFRPLQRIYWSGRELLVRETISYPGFRLTSLPDASYMIATACVEPVCAIYDGSEPGTPGRTSLYESRDGGITWEKLVDFDVPWVADRILPAEDGEIRLLLAHGTGLWGPGALWSSSGGIQELPDPSPTLEWQGIWCGEWRLSWCVSLPDGRVMLAGSYDAEELIGPKGAAEGRPIYQFTDLPWPTIRDPETAEVWPIWMPADVLRTGETLILVAAQHGPSLRVVDAGEDCLPIRAEPLPDAEEVACMAERVLLQDRREASEVDGTAWRRVKTPAGVEGWADGRYLE